MQMYANAIAAHDILLRLAHKPQLFSSSVSCRLCIPQVQLMFTNVRKPLIVEYISRNSWPCLSKWVIFILFVILIYHVTVESTKWSLKWCKYYQNRFTGIAIISLKSQPPLHLLLRNRQFSWYSPQQREGQCLKCLLMTFIKIKISIRSILCYAKMDVPLVEFMYSHARWVTVGDWGLCCCVCVTSFER